MNDSSAVLSAREVTLGYRDTAVVQGASISLTHGEVTVLVGPNGSGKSTLLRALAKLHHVDAGTVCLDTDSDVRRIHGRDFAKRVTMLSQTRPHPSGLTVHDVVSFGRHPHRSRFGSTSEEDREAVAWALEVTGVAGFARRSVEELSGGEIQRVWLAMCLAQRTDVLLLDEPTNHLDLRYQVETLDLARDLAVDHGVAVGMVLHDLNQAGEVADRIVLLQQGTVRASGAPADVLCSQTLTEVYGLDIDSITDPETGRVRTQPRSRHSHRRPGRLLTHQKQENPAL